MPGPRSWITGHVGDKAVWVIVVGAFLAALGAAAADPVVRLVERVYEICCAADPQLNLYARLASNSQPITGMRFQVLDSRSLKPIVLNSGGERVLVTREGLATGDVRIKAGAYALRASYMHDGILFNRFEPVEISGNFSQTVDFDPAKWFAAAQTSAPTVTIAAKKIETDDEPRWMTIARAEIGTREFAPPRSNPAIEQYFRAVGVDYDQTMPWNGAFVAWVVSQARFKVAPRPLQARSWLSWGTPSQPKLGCLAILWRGDPSGFSGHVGFLVAIGSDYVDLLGGNQQDEVNVSRFARSRLLGCRWPESSAALQRPDPR